MSRPKLGCPTGTSIRTQPASLQTGQRHVGVAVAEPLLPAGPTGMEREVRTSPMRFIGFPAAPRYPYRSRGSRPSLCRSEEHTSELQSRQYLVCRLLLEKKKKNITIIIYLQCTNH